MMDTVDESLTGNEPVETYVCCKCDRELPLDELEEFDGEFLCDDCLKEYTFICCDCGNRCWTEFHYTYHDELLCDSCFDYHYHTCTCCDRVIHNEDTYYLDEDENDNDEPYCYNCFEQRKCECSIKSYNYKPEPIFYGEGIFYGVELEIDMGGECRDNAQRLLEIGNRECEHIYCKHDGSLKCGFEIVSHPMSLEYHLTKMPWNAVMAEAVRLGYKSHYCTTSGLHIHVGRNELSLNCEEQEDVIARIMFFIEKHWDRMLVFSRRTEEQINQWASRYGCKENPKATLENAKDSGLGRYVCLNLQNYDTIEFRLFRGTLRYATLAATLQLVDEICRTAMDLSDDEFQAMEWLDFTSRIDPGRTELLSYMEDKSLCGEAF